LAVSYRLDWTSNTLEIRVPSDLKTVAHDRKFVSILRDELDSSSIDGFVLGYSDDLLLIQNVYDFRLDGLKVIRIADITAIESGATREFQKKLLVTEGLFQQIDFESPHDLRDWSDILTQFSLSRSLVILENEQQDDSIFLIGKIQKIGESGVSLRSFSGVGEWDEYPTLLPFSIITACSVDTNYSNVYQRHFERNCVVP
jgi:hypothetical protein